MKGRTNAKKFDFPYVPPTFANGTDAEIIEALEQHYLGNIDLHDYWSVGDTRTITLTDSTSTEFVLMDSTCTGFTLNNEQVTPMFICGMKNCYITGYMNSTNTNTGGWQDSYMRNTTMTNFRSLIPTSIKDIFKQFTWQQGTGGGVESGLYTTQDYFGLAPAQCVFGSTAHYAQTDEDALYSQWEWYQTASNRIKTLNGSARDWWECSPSRVYSNRFCSCNNDSSANIGYPSSSFGISPFGCI